MENNIDEIKTSGVVMTFHTDDCTEENINCKCSEKEGNQIKEKLFKMSGKIEGEKISYWFNGNVFSKCSYINGKLEGEMILYHFKGNVKIKLFCQNGKIEGEFITYWSNRNIRENALIIMEKKKENLFRSTKME